MSSGPRLAIGLFSLALFGCQAIGIGPAPTAVPPSATPAPPTPTPEPTAALVGGEPILLSSFEEEVRRYEQAQAELGIDLATDPAYRQRVLQALIDRRLLDRGAGLSGLAVSAAEVDERLQALAGDSGGQEALAAWMTANGYTTESFLATLREEMQAQRMVDQIAGSVPEAIEQVQARHILVSSRQEAQPLLDQIVGGADFGALAATYSRDLSTRPGGGDLGWFPRDYLASPELEQAAFSLQPGELFPEVIESRLGFHVLQVLDRGQHPLSPEASRRMRLKAVEDWLDLRRKDTEIIILVDNG
ncbi:MAG: peptidylprolyl isomerase [Anaerolineales bacterium]|nr:peptidylprolyl isomerase [Anaerolineales bacterium]